MRAVPVAYDPFFAAKNYREKWERRGAAQLLGDDWWTRLHEAVREYIELDIELTRIGVRMQKASGEDRKALDQKNHELQAGNRLCRMTAESLAAARKTFGRETFDRFLYQCIAPDAFHVTSTSSAEGLADTFLWVEGGCR